MYNFLVQRKFLLKRDQNTKFDTKKLSLLYRLGRQIGKPARKGISQPNLKLVRTNLNYRVLETSNAAIFFLKD